jgi:hypothetical protein
VGSWSRRDLVRASSPHSVCPSCLTHQCYITTRQEPLLLPQHLSISSTKSSCLLLRYCDYLTAQLPHIRGFRSAHCSISFAFEFNLHVRVACSRHNRLSRATSNWPTQTNEHISSTSSFFLRKPTTRWRLRSSARWPLLAAVRLVCSTLAPVLMSFDQSRSPPLLCFCTLHIL